MGSSKANLADAIDDYFRLTTKQAEAFARLKLNTLFDLVFHLPVRYENKTQITPLQDCWAQPHSNIQEKKLLYGTLISKAPLKKPGSFKCVVQDEKGYTITLIFLHRSQHWWSKLLPATQLLIYGKLSIYQDSLSIVHPELRLCKPDMPPQLSQHLTPIYRLTQGFYSERFSYYVMTVLENVPDDLKVFESPRLGEGLPSLKEALTCLHFPTVSDFQGKMSAALARLKCEESFAQLCAEKLLSKEYMASHSASPVTATISAQEALKAAFGHAYSDSQKEAMRIIDAYLASTNPNPCLVQGDVGSGKTILAAYASLAAFAHHMQVAIMAPTEILAQQHFHSFTQWFGQTSLRLGLLISSLSARDKRKILAALAAGEIDCIIGTQALIQETVAYKHLGLIIIDEQHRFGVNDRFALLGKASADLPHQIWLSATPIPRTLAMSLYGNVVLCPVKKRPNTHAAIQTIVMHAQNREKICQRIRKKLDSGEQVYWVCPAIQDSENQTTEIRLSTVEQMEVFLSQELSAYRSAVLHGKIAAKEKEAILADFRCGAIHLLIATTVIEVGIDFPSATVIVIENADRFGLAQLHQLRGRVGRGVREGTCILLYEGSLSMTAKQRLEALRTSGDGAHIAQMDLKLRGPGEVLGTMQSGIEIGRIASFQEILEWQVQLGDLAENFCDRYHALANKEAYLEPLNLWFRGGFSLRRS